MTDSPCKANVCHDLPNVLSFQLLGGCSKHRCSANSVASTFSAHRGQPSEHDKTVICAHFHCKPNQNVASNERAVCQCFFDNSLFSNSLLCLQILTISSTSARPQGHLDCISYLTFTNSVAQHFVLMLRLLFLLNVVWCSALFLLGPMPPRRQLTLADRQELAAKARLGKAAKRESLLVEDAPAQKRTFLCKAASLQNVAVSLRVNLPQLTKHDEPCKLRQYAHSMLHGDNKRVTSKMLEAAMAHLDHRTMQHTAQSLAEILVLTDREHRPRIERAVVSSNAKKLQFIDSDMADETPFVVGVRDEVPSVSNSSTAAASDSVCIWEAMRHDVT